MAEADTDFIPERGFPKKLAKWNVEARENGDSGRISELAYLGIMDRIVASDLIIKMRREKNDAKSLREVLRLLERSGDLYFPDESYAIFHFGSIIKASNWLNLHPESEEARTILRQGSLAALSTHSIFYIDVLFEDSYITTQGSSTTSWRQH